MRKDVLIQLSGWSMILGAIAFLPGAIGMLFYESQRIKVDAPGSSVPLALGTYVTIVDYNGPI